MFRQIPILQSLLHIGSSNIRSPEKYTLLKTWYNFINVVIGPAVHTRPPKLHPRYIYSVCTCPQWMRTWFNFGAIKIQLIDES